MMAEPRVAGGLDWLLDDLVSRVEQVWHAVILSRDGLAIGASRSITRDDAEHLSALPAGTSRAAPSGRRSSRWRTRSCS
jgi:predicted regulator of Ras-like GTPase activity (Roadblock/LC7/MglB family)